MSETTTVCTPLFQPGDVVTVCRNLSVFVPYAMNGEDMSFGGCTFITGMSKFYGKPVTIKEIIRDNPSHPRYHIYEDNGAFYWTDGMFEPPASYASLEVDERDWSSFFGGFSGR